MFQGTLFVSFYLFTTQRHSSGHNRTGRSTGPINPTVGPSFANFQGHVDVTVFTYPDISIGFHEPELISGLQQDIPVRLLGKSR